jgi:hypothetical protein
MATQELQTKLPDVNVCEQRCPRGRGRVTPIRYPSVPNHLKVLLPLENYRDDDELTMVADNTLAANGMMPDGVEAMVRSGNLKLTGTVNYGYQRAAAESAVAGLTGVCHTNNKIVVTYDTDSADITQQVQGALAQPWPATHCFLMTATWRRTPFRAGVHGS